MDIFEKTLDMKFEQSKQEIEYGIYGDTDVLKLIKYLFQNKYKCIIFESKIIALIERVVRIYG